VSDAAAPFVAVEALSKRFAAAAGVDPLNFTVSRGEIFGLVGPDGAGKTTTMRMLAGVMRPDAGTVVIDDTDIVAQPERGKQWISYMPQRFGLYEDLTVDENIRFYADLFDIAPAERERRAARLLAASGMGAFRGRRAGQLSGGMKQKLGLACALIHTPRLLLLDEPTTGVDVVSRREFWHILYSLREEGVTVIISTSYLDEAERCNRLALLHRGRLMYCDTPAALKAHLPGALVAISSSAAREARNVLSRLEGVANATLVGNGVHVLVDDAARRMPDFRRALAAAAVPFDEIATVAPTIEDLFAALLQNDENAA